MRRKRKDEQGKTDREQNLKYEQPCRVQKTRNRKSREGCRPNDNANYLLNNSLHEANKQKTELQAKTPPHKHETDLRRQLQLLGLADEGLEHTLLLHVGGADLHAVNAKVGVASGHLGGLDLGQSLREER